MASVDDLLGYAKTQLGKTYVFGATGPDTFDCSGLVQYVFHHFGTNLPRTSQEQAKVGTPVATNQIQAGDLVFSDWGDGPNSHVGIATAANQIIDAPHTGAVVRYDTLNAGYLSHVTAVRRMGLDGTAAGATGPAGAGNALTSLTDPLNGIVQPLQDIATAIGDAAKVADLVTKAFMPSNFIRIVSGLAGGVFILFGIFLLSREVRPV